jgi:hypothetical protein
MTPPETEDRPQAPSKRLPYEKPVLRSISLVANQVLGLGCKSSSGTTNYGNTDGCLSVKCYESGS